MYTGAFTFQFCHLRGEPWSGNNMNENATEQFDFGLIPSSQNHKQLYTMAPGQNAPSCDPLTYKLMIASIALYWLLDHLYLWYIFICKISSISNAGIEIRRFWVYEVICHKLVLKSVSYPKIVENTPILIEESIACNVYT